MIGPLEEFSTGKKLWREGFKTESIKGSIIIDIPRPPYIVLFIKIKLRNVFNLVHITHFQKKIERHFLIERAVKIHIPKFRIF